MNFHLHGDAAKARRHGRAVLFHEPGWRKITHGWTDGGKRSSVAVGAKLTLDFRDDGRIGVGVALPELHPEMVVAIGLWMVRLKRGVVSQCHYWKCQKAFVRRSTKAEKFCPGTKHRSWAHRDVFKARRRPEALRTKGQWK